MKLLLITFASILIGCTNYNSKSRVERNSNMYYPQKNSDTFFYNGIVSYHITPADFDTTFVDTAFVIRFHEDSFKLHWKTIYFVNRSGYVSGRPAISFLWQAFSLEDTSFSVHDISKYLDYDSKITFSKNDSLKFTYSDRDKFNSIYYAVSFKGKKMQKTKEPESLY